MNEQTNKKTHLLISLLLSFILAITASILVANNFPSSLENMIEDSLYQQPTVIPYNIKIIAIDEETLDNLGPYSDWNRAFFANLINILNVDEDTKPTVIGMDIMFTGTNNSEGDQSLANAAKKYGNLILASSLNFDNDIIKGIDGKYYATKYASKENKPYESLAANSECGFTNAIFDKDGFVRRTYTKIPNADNSDYYETFAYKIASKIASLKEYNSIEEIAFTGNPGDFEVIPMTKILDGSVPGSYFDDCIVLVGAYEEGMMDAYNVPIDYSKEMYGVEMQANYINAYLKDKFIYSIPIWIQFIICFTLTFLYCILAMNYRIRYTGPAIIAFLAVHFSFALIIFKISSCKTNLIGVPIGLISSFLIILIYKYILMQKRRAVEMQDMLFSMAEAMAEAIEGRTPYNANHTKNVAKRSVEMLDYINKLHKENKTELHFTNADKKQIYLAAMLHDVGKMDVPLEVMDKPTKLGSKEGPLRDRLTIISLKIQNDALTGRISKEEADIKCEKINEFVDKLGLFNCGKPLNDEEWAIVNGIADSKYIDEDGNETPYLTTEEIDDIHIKAGTLSDNERTIMQSHVVYTDKILSHMKFGVEFKDVRAMAANHHEVLNGKGYPKGLGEKDLDVMTRILTIMDIYDSLIADDRPYKKPKPINIAFKILDEEADFGKVDKELLEFAKQLYMPNQENNKE